MCDRQVFGWRAVGDCRVVCNPRGYKRLHSQDFEIKGFDPGLVVDV